MASIWRSIDEECKEVKNSMNTPLDEEQIWQPIATKWYEKWKIYVNFDGNDASNGKEINVIIYLCFISILIVISNVIK